MKWTGDKRLIADGIALLAGNEEDIQQLTPKLEEAAGEVGKTKVDVRGNNKQDTNKSWYTANTRGGAIHILRKLDSQGWKPGVALGKG